MKKDQLKITYQKTGDLVPYARNSRTHSEEQVSQIAASIREFGFTNPVLVDEENTIIAGHGRIMAAQKLGLGEVPTITLAGLTETQRKAYIIADNRLALNAGWDDEMLRLEIADLKEADFDLDLLGFEDDEIAALEVEVVDGQTDPDEVPEPPADPVTVLGDIWTLGNHRLMCGDSTSIDAAHKLMEKELAQLLHTDPPYGVDYEGVTNDHLKAEKLREFITEALKNAFCILSEGSNAYVWHPDVHAYEFIGAFRDAGFQQAKPSTIQWVKDSLVLSQGDYHSRNEPCLFGWKKGEGRVRVEDRKQDTIWEFPKPKKSGEHPTMKPIELCERAINNSSKKGFIVLDIFGGSGSTLIACEKTGRKARLMELAPNYCDVIVKRWQDFTGKKAVHESGKTFDEMAASRGK